MDQNPYPFDTNPIDFKQQKELTNLLLEKSYQEITSQYDWKDFFQKVLDYGAWDNIITLANVMAEHFFDPRNYKLTPEARDKIINTIAAIQQGEPNEEIEKKLKIIDPSFSLPEDFDAVDFQRRAAEIKNGYQNFKMAMADENYSKYVDDTSNFVQMNSEKFQGLEKEIEETAIALQGEYLKMDKGTPRDPEVIRKAADVIGKCGRIPLSVESLKEANNLGEISETIQKLSISIRIAKLIREKNLQNLNKETIIVEIKKYLVEKSVL